MAKYKTPSEYKFRIHHVRSRFKNDVESVLLHMATSMADLKPCKKRAFDAELDKRIRMFPGNADKSDKTIRNWRTEISSMFGFIASLGNGTVYAGDNAVMLADRNDLVEFFKYFLYTFQYPGGHTKPSRTAEAISYGVRFKPAQYILKLMRVGERVTNRPFWINKAEAAHLIFNDLRVTRDCEDPKYVVDRILQHRDNATYDQRGDVIRYAGDILDYMVHANLLTRRGGKYYINQIEGVAIEYIVRNDTWFAGFDSMYGRCPTVEEVRNASQLWFLYVNSNAGKIKFETDLFGYIGGSMDSSAYEKLAMESAKRLPTVVEIAHELTDGSRSPTTKSIGDAGETLVHGHECASLKKNGREDLVRKVVIIPTHLAMGYDIRSYDTHDDLKHIEVKTTISRNALTVNSFHLTDNEWNTADKLGSRYYVYRLQITRDDQKAKVHMVIIRNPVELFKNENLYVKPSNGMDVTLRPGAGTREDLLIWEN